MANDGNPTFMMALQSKKRVMNAVILRDMRSRFMNHGLGFLIVPLFPFAHLFALTSIYFVLGRHAPFGNDVVLFFAISIIPSLIFMYVSRFMSISLVANRTMLAFPKVQILDVIFGRALLEIAGIMLSCVGIFVVLLMIGSNPSPIDPLQVLMALFSIILLSVGMGILVSLIAIKLSFVATIWSISMILVYLLSGFFYVPSYLPEQIGYPLSWNPIIHATEWMRSAFYLGYPDQFLDKQYLVSWAFGSAFAGLLLERLLRNKLKSS